MRRAIWLLLVGVASSILWLALFVSVAYAPPPMDAGPEAPRFPERPGVAVDAPTPETDAERPEQDAQAEPVQPALPAPTVERESEPPRSDERSAAAEQREKDDLVAQQSMARAADDMLYLSKWQLGLAIIGVIAIITTLLYTAKTANAAIEANNLNREAFINDQRAWLDVDVEVISDLVWNPGPTGGGYFIIAISVTNCGKSPAHKRLSRGNLTTSSGRRIWKLQKTAPLKESATVRFSQNGKLSINGEL